MESFCTRSSIFLSQSKYAKNLVKKFGLEFASSVRTPMSPNVKLFVNLLGKSVDSSFYKSMIGSLLYLTTSRPNISYNVGVCARYQANPKESHMIALKKIIKYVETTTDFGVWYSKDTNNVLTGYSDTDWAGNTNDRKSTSGGCFYVGNNLVSRISKKQNSISLSTTEAEYIPADSCCTQLLWMQKLLHDYGICQQHLTVVEGKFFTPHGFILLATHTTSILSWILGESILKPKRVLIHKNDAKAHGPKLMLI